MLVLNCFDAQIGCFLCANLILQWKRAHSTGIFHGKIELLRVYPLYAIEDTYIFEASWSCSLSWWDVQPSLQHILDSLKSGSWYGARPFSGLLIYMLRFAYAVPTKTTKVLAPNLLAQ